MENKKENMTDKIQNIMAVPMNYTAYAIPITSLGPARGLADHTYVIAVNQNNINNIPQVIECPCYGTSPAGGNMVSNQVNGDMSIASAMISGNFGIRNVYDNWLTDHCGLIYALQGVCHNMCNRILSAVAFPTVMNMDQVHGSWLSLILYGVYGLPQGSFMGRLHDILRMAALGSDRDHGSRLTTDDDESYEEFVQRYKVKVLESNDLTEVLRELILAELDEESTPWSRAKIICRSRLTNLTENMKSDTAVNIDDIAKNLGDAISEYNKLLEELTESMPKDDKGEIVPDYEKLKGMSKQINEGFKKFNRSAYEILGQNYTTLFGEEYSEDYVLYMPELIEIQK